VTRQPTLMLRSAVPRLQCLQKKAVSVRQPCTGSNDQVTGSRNVRTFDRDILAGVQVNSMLHEARFTPAQPSGACQLVC